MGLFRKNVYVSYDEDKVDLEDLEELREEMEEMFREQPETYQEKKRLTIIHTGMLNNKLKLMKKKIKREAIKLKKKILKKENPLEILARLEHEISELEQKIETK